MDMIVGEKNWEKFRFAKAEKQYYEMLSKDMQFESKILHRRITMNSKVRQLNDVKEKSCFVASRKKLGTDKHNVKRTKDEDASINKQSILVSEIAKAREHIKNSLEKMDGISCVEATAIPPNIIKRLEILEEENNKLKKLISSLNDICIDSQKRISALEVSIKSNDPVTQKSVEDDDGVDLFASESDEESEEAARIREERLAAYAAKKSKKPILIAKSSLVLDVKPWDDETDLKEMETLIRNISTDGLLWGASKLVPVAFGINKLSISCVVEDDKVSIDWLTEEIEKNDQFVQSVDVAAFNKI